MKPRCTRALLRPSSLLATLVLLLAAPVFAQVPQTIVIDGVNDFDAANLLENDGGDTQEINWCADDPAIDTPMDIKAVYVTNDANNLYIGFEYDRECFASPAVNLGIAFSYGAPGDGGTTDPFNRKIAWNTIADKPDNVVYAVIDGFNYEVLYQWNGASWSTVQAGSNELGMVNDTGFEELAIPLASFTNGVAGLSGGDALKIELWMTQDGTTKPALDAVASDAAQQSTPSGTVFDVNTAPIEMTGYLNYTIIDVSDNEAPTVTGVQLVDGNRSSLRVTFNEPLSQASAETAANYLVGGANPSSATLTAPNQVTLALAAPLAGNAGLYLLGVNGVADAAANVASANYDFAVKDIVFEGLFGPFLQTNATGPSDFFTVEGSRSPLDFNPVAGDDEMVLFDAVNDIYRLTVPFSWFVGPNGGAAITPSIVVEWKFTFNLSYENGSNQVLNISSTNAASTVVSRYWEDLDPTQFTQGDIDVIFTVDMNGQGVIPGDTVELAGNVVPLSFSAPYVTMADDGLGQDAAAGDGIFTAVVTFPAGSLKNVNFKYVFNGSFECFGQGDRYVFLNDAQFDTIGGTNGPLVLPLATYDRCTALAGDSLVIFRVDIGNSIYDANGDVTHEVRLGGNVAPLVFDPIGDAVLMADNGLFPDDVAGDLIYSVAVTFPDSSNRFLEYKYIVDGGFEGLASPNRTVTLEDQYDTVGNPQILPVDDVHVTQPVGVDTPVRNERMTVKAMPNPFNPRTTIVFEMPSRGDVSVSVYDSRGRHVRDLHTGVLDAGEHSRVWDGKTDDGASVSSGVYFVRVLGQGQAAGTRVVLVK